MAKKFGKCINYGGCDRADRREPLEVASDQEFLCPECARPLDAVEPGKAANPRAKAFAAMGGLVLLAASGASYWFLQPAAPVRTVAGKAPACALKPAVPNDVARLLTYLKQGMNFAGREQWSDALSEFSEIDKIDRNFLSVALNRGSALLRLGRLDDAALAMQAEIALAECLQKIEDDAQLAAFGYMLEVAAKSTPDTVKQRAQLLRERMSQLSAQAHFNLACIRARQQVSEAAVNELRVALELDATLVAQARIDTDLASVRMSAHFKALVEEKSR